MVGVLSMHAQAEGWQQENRVGETQKLPHARSTAADGMLAKDADKVIQRLANRMDERTQKPYASVVQYLRLRLSVCLVKAVHMCIRKSRKKKTITSRFLPPQPTQPFPELRMLLQASR